MAYKEVLRVEISEVIRRWQAGNSQRRIASGTGLSRDRWPDTSLRLQPWAYPLKEESPARNS